MKILPTGLESKNKILALSNLTIIALCNLVVPIKNMSKMVTLLENTKIIYPMIKTPYIIG